MTSIGRPEFPGRSRRGKLSRPARKLVLAVHVGTSVGWLGVSVCLLALSLVGLLAEDPMAQQGAYLSLGALATFVTPPLSLGALVTGVLISLGTKWGLFRHHWVVISLVLTTVMNGAVLFALGPMLRAAAGSARQAPPGTSVVDAVGNHAVAAVVAPIVAIVVLSAVTALNVFKPPGRFGNRT